MPNQPQVVKFGVFEVDLQAGEVRKAGMRQKLAGQPFQVLRALVERPREILTREELRDVLWPGNTFVDYDLALKKAVNRVREVLGDSAESPRFIETIPRHGYRFLAQVQSVEATHARPVRRKAPWKPAASLAVLATAGVLLALNAGKLRTPILANSRSEVSAETGVILTCVSTRGSVGGILPEFG